MKTSSDIGWTPTPHEYNPSDKEKVDEAVEGLEDLLDFIEDSRASVQFGSLMFKMVIDRWNEVNSLTPIGTQEWLTAWDTLAAYINNHPETAKDFVRAGAIPASQLPQNELEAIKGQMEDFERRVESIIDDYLDMGTNIRTSKINELREELATAQVHLRNNKPFFSQEEYARVNSRIQEVLDHMDRSVKFAESVSEYRGR